MTFPEQEAIDSTVFFVNERKKEEVENNARKAKAVEMRFLSEGREASASRNFSSVRPKRQKAENVPLRPAFKGYFSHEGLAKSSATFASPIVKPSRLPAFVWMQR